MKQRLRPPAVCLCSAYAYPHRPYGGACRSAKPVDNFTAKRCTRTKHRADCRPGRPHCRWSREANPKSRRCFCAAYHHPHRWGGGICAGGEPNAERMWAAIEKTIRRAV